MSAQAPPTNKIAQSSTSATNPTLRIGTRSSALALAQVDLFTSLLPPTVRTSTHAISTSPGDADKVSSLSALATLPEGKSLWTSSLETKLSNNEVDVLIHSLKDVPTTLPQGFLCVAIGSREEAGDCVVLSPAAKGRGIRGLRDLEKEGKEEGTVGTSSVRRTAMIARNFPSLRVRDCRGNVPTRIKKLEEGQFDAVVLASAGVKRLGLWDKVDEVLEGGKTEDARDGEGEGLDWGHAVGQGALGVEWREGDKFVEELIGGVEETVGRRTRWEGVAERALLRVLEGGCSVPVGAECWWEQQQAGGSDEGVLWLKALVVSVDGKQLVQGTRQKTIASDGDAEALGVEAAEDLMEKGAGVILKEIEASRARTTTEGYTQTDL